MLNFIGAIAAAWAAGGAAARREGIGFGFDRLNDRGWFPPEPPIQLCP
jgi:hypothetical protein